MSLESTPRSNQLHIGIYGRRNSGKSSLINAITNQEISLVSDVLGTTTDPVYKTMEINGIGPCVFIDTAGIDDQGELGMKRVEKTKLAIDKTDVALIICTSTYLTEEAKWVELLKNKGVSYLTVINKSDLIKNIKEVKDAVEKELGSSPFIVSAVNKEGIEELIAGIADHLPADFEKSSIVGDLAVEGDTVLLVMPQDIQAPKGRLILPQVQILREKIKKKCIVTSVTTDKLDIALASYAQPPKLIITDSQIFDLVCSKKPMESKLTSFSVLFAGYKGDIGYYVDSAKKIDELTKDSKVLIAEACTHVPLAEDIGREQIPRLLRNLVGPELVVDVVCGGDFPEDLTGYDLVIQCGACMFNRKYVMSRIDTARAQNVPMSNYGVAIAHIKGILDKVSF